MLALCQVDIPAFLESISPDAQEELDEIVSDGEQTKHQMNEKLDDWAQRQPPGFAVIFTRCVYSFHVTFDVIITFDQ